MSVRIINADVMDGLRQLPAESVHCCITSPPYWGLRDYGVPGQIGLETSPDDFVAKMVEVFREVWRVLRHDGTCWLNLGDSYAGGARGGGSDDCKQRTNVGSLIKAPKWSEAFRPGNPDKNGGVSNRDGLGTVRGLKAKDLCGMPWRVAFALQADGWYLRSDIIWHKPNPMPESVTDRPTKAHEYVFLLTKSERYYFDNEAIKEETVEDRALTSWEDRKQNEPIRRVDPGQSGHITTTATLASRPGRNKRSVWTVATAPYSEAHFATFPHALIEPMILAGTSEKGCCAKCGAPWARQIERPKPPSEVYTKRSAPTDELVYSGSRVAGVMVGHGQKLQNCLNANPPKTVGWLAACACDAAVVPCAVLDPFSGAGTTALVADRLQRSAIGIELNPEYVAMSEKRIAGDAPLFAMVDAG